MKKNYLIVIMLLSILQINAATIFVTNTNDTGTGSLRDAIGTALSGDIIRFNSSLINTGSATITLQSSISVDKGVFIKGLYTAIDTLYIKSNGSTIFQLNYSGTTFPRFDLDSVVLSDAISAISGSSFPILNTDIRVQNSIIRDCSNSAINLSPWQVGTNEISLNISNSNIYNNTGTKGGAINMDTESAQGRTKITLNISNSYIHNNTSTSDGGGVYMYTKTGVWGYRSEIACTINESTFSNNNSGNDGGGIYAYAYTVANYDDAKTRVTTTKSTFVNNSAVNNGGAIYARIWGSDYVEFSYVVANNSTFVNNSANTDGASIYNKSNGTFRDRIYLTSSIIAFNSGTAGLYGSQSSLNSFNIYSGTVSNTNGNQTGATLANLNLGILQNNGGFAPTMLPNLPSIAIDLGDSTDLSSAQNGPILGRRDVGAAESNYCSTPIMIDSGNVEICSGDSYNFRGQNYNTTGTYYDTVQGMIGCDSVYFIHIDVLNQATPTISISSNMGNTICNGALVMFTATTTNSGASPFYEWKKNGSTVGNGTTLSTSIINNGDVITCKLISSRPCVTTNAITSNSIIMNVNSSVTPTLSISVSPSNNIVFGTTSTFVATPTNGGTSPAYQWKINGSNVGANSPSYTSNSLSNGDVISCQVTSNSQCAIPSTATSNAITMTVSSNLTNDLPCSATLLNVNNTCQYNYYDNTLATITNTLPIPNCLFTAERDVWFKVVAPSSGQFTVYTQAAGMQDGVLTLYYGNSCNGLIEFGCIDDVGSNLMPYTTATGLIPGEIIYLRIQGANSNDYGSFGLCVFDANISTDIVKTEARPLSIKVYPNPATDIVNIELSKSSIENSNVIVYDVQGKKMNIPVDFLTDKIQLNVSQLARGVYTISVTNDNIVMTKCIVITK